MAFHFRWTQNLDIQRQAQLLLGHPMLSSRIIFDQGVLWLSVPSVGKGTELEPRMSNVIFLFGAIEKDRKFKKGKG